MENKEFHTVRGYQLIAQKDNMLTSAMEDYLEMIYRFILQEDSLRINKLADLLNVKASSATKMVQKLGEIGLLNYEKYGIVELTDDGREIGKYLLSRHNTIEEFLKTIGIKDNLFIETELIEHYISTNTLKIMNNLIQFFADNDRIQQEYEKYNATKKQ